MISTSEGGRQRLIDRRNEVAKSYKMKINVKKKTNNYDNVSNRGEDG